MYKVKEVFPGSVITNNRAFNLAGLSVAVSIFNAIVLDSAFHRVI